MTYVFECPACKTKKEIDIAMSEYDKEKNNQFCDCGQKLKRVFEPIGLTIYNCQGFYDTNSRGVKGR